MNGIQESANKYSELHYQNTGRVLPQLGYDETKLLKRMFKEQERLDMELKNSKNKDKYKENQHRIEDLKNKIGNMLKINADQITKIVREEIRNENELRTKSTKTNFKTALREKSAVIIQSVFRGYLARKLFKRLIIERNKANCRNLLKSKSVPTLQSNIKSYTNLNLSSEKKHYLSPDSLFFPEEESILVFGGMDPHTDYGGKKNSGKNIYRYLANSDKWELVGEMPEPLHHHGATFYKGKVIIADSSPCRCPSCSKVNTTFEKKPKGVFSTVVEPNQNINNAHFETESSKIDKNEKCLTVNEHRNEIPVQEKEYQEPTKLNQFSSKQVLRPSGDDIINYTDQYIKFDVCPARGQQLECGDMAQRSQARKSVPCPKQHTEVCVKGVKELPEKQEKTGSGNKESVFPFRNTPSGNLIVVPHQAYIYIARAGQQSLRDRG